MVKDYQEATLIAKKQAGQRFEDYMLISWYDRDRDSESPPNITEKPGDGPKNGYINYGVNHGAIHKVDIKNGKFVFFFTPIKW